ncbi:hypothetical protein H2202_009815 [Exophiala xenobiotica]|nr:hypothetical protein H2202_009815 [Exophiala xenobiotica]KAK5404257.1 hypothetical protein LTR06_009816 [Exophiala xenobiotica]
MSTEPSPSVSVLNVDGNGPVHEWQEFLVQPEIGCQLGATNGISGPDVTCNFTSDGLWGYVFDSSTNKAQFGVVSSQLNDNVVLSGLKSANVSPTLIQALQKFGVAGPHDEIPGDNGSLPVVNSATAPLTPPASTAPSGLIESLVENISHSQVLQVLQTGISKTERNAVWFTPGVVFRTDIALTFGLASGAETILQSMATSIAESSFNLHLTPNNEKIDFKIQLQKTLYGAQTSLGDGPLQWEVTNTYRLAFLFAVGAFLFSITLTPSGIDFSVTQNPDSTVVASLLSLTGQDNSSLSTDVVVDNLLSDVRILKASVNKSFGSTADWRITIGLVLGSMEVYLDYSSSSELFTGGLILQGFYALESDKLFPDYHTGQVIVAPDANYQPKLFWDIKDLSKDFQSIPAVFPTAIVLATVAFSKSPTQVWFAAKLISPSTVQDNGDPPVPAPFTWDELDVRLSKSAGRLSSALSTRFTLETPTKDAFADLGLSIAYTGGDWLIMGYAENLTGAMLFQFFDPAFRDPLTAVLGPLTIPTLQVAYTYEKGGVASSFAFIGVVQLGKLQLRLVYQYANSKVGANTAATQTLPADQKSKAMPPVSSITDPKNPSAQLVQTEWDFACDLGAAPGADVTLGQVIDSIVDGGADSLPTFLTNIPFPAVGTDRSLISIKVAKFGTGSVLFALRFTLDGFTFTFAQVGGKAGTKTKQMLRFSVAPLTVMKDIPLINTLPQPFDQLEYVWVNDAGGFLQSEADALNQKVLGGDDSLFYRQLVGQGPKAAPSNADNVVLVPGHHFIVVRNQQATLDHVFAATTPSVAKTLSGPSSGGSTGQPTGQPTGQSTGQASQTADVSTIPPPASPPSKGAVEFTIGPLSISAVALQYKEQGGKKVISLTMDATFVMGPISFSLLGFGFDVPLDAITLDSFSSLTSIQPEISGLSLSFDNPPLLIAGGFEHKTIGSLATNDFQNIYLGGIGISWPPYTFVGLGEYAVLEDYKSIFLYAKLDGPLITLEFATISGIRMGFGYNSVVRSPAMDELTVFPFIDDRSSSSSAGDNPLQIVKNMTQAVGNTAAWVSPKQDSYWFAVGMTAAAFDILTITAVAMLAFRDSGVIVSLYADAVAQMPPDAKSTSEMIVYVELGLVAEMNFIDGYFRVEAALAPTSFLLVKDCHLYGGFALVYWFGTNPHAGDWVFSVGGYHPKYQKPDWYPAVQRLGISWNPGKCMSVTGEAYFAVTPKVVMGGAMIRVTLSIGPVGAWLEASFDCLINFHPLHYSADFNVSIGVTFDMDFWFIHIHIECSVGAWLTVQGPDFGGVAHVDFYLFGFDVDFGSSPEAKPALFLIEFWSMLHQPGPVVDSQNAVASDRLRPRLMLDPNVNPDPTMGPQYQVYTPPSGVPIEGAAFKYVLEDGNYTQAQRPPSGSTSTAAGAGTGNNAPAASAPTNTGAGAKWFVKGGSFKFRIATDFALSHALVQAGDDGDGDAVEVKNPNEKSPAPVQKPGQKPDTGIYSRPMHVDQGITSELTVKIYKKAEELVETGTGKPTIIHHVVGGWTEGAFDIKAVPQATWGKYSIDTDPMASAATSLLSHDDATTPLGMALKLTAPLPYLAKSFIPVFKAADAAVMGVEDFRYNADGDHWYLPVYEPLVKPNLVKPPPRPPLPEMVPSQSLYIPSELTDVEQKEQKETPQQRWDDVGSKWTSLAADKKSVVGDPTDGLIARVCDIFQWEKGWQVKQSLLSGSGKASSATEVVPATTTKIATSPVALGKQTSITATTAPPAWQLTGNFPAKLVRDVNQKGTMVKNLESTYLALPRLAVVS